MGDLTKPLPGGIFQITAENGFPPVFSYGTISVMATLDKQGSFLTGQLLVAMPGLQDPRFAQTVIYMCAHSFEGAMGIVINKVLESLSFPDLLEQLGIESSGLEDQIAIHSGGPVEAGRGFVLHTPEYVQESTLIVNPQVALTATVDILKDMAGGNGPHHSLLALGYSGWGPGQLDSEIMANGWLNVDPDEDLIFGPDMDGKWEQAMAKIGIDPRMLSEDAGHA